MTEEEIFTRYYLAQAGSGIGDFYSGPIYQRGYGIGSFLGGLFRSILPILKKGSIAVGKEILSSGSHFLNDIGNDVKPRDALRSRAREAYNNIKRKAMHGEGYKAVRTSKKRQLSSSSGRANIKRKKVVNKEKPVTKKRTLQKKKDIFYKQNGIH